METPSLVICDLISPIISSFFALFIPVGQLIAESPPGWQGKENQEASEGNPHRHRENINKRGRPGDRTRNLLVVRQEC